MKKKCLYVLIPLVIILLSYLGFRAYQSIQISQKYNNAKSSFIIASKEKDYQKMLVSLTNSTYFAQLLKEKGYSYKIYKNSIREIEISKSPKIVMSAPFGNRQLGGNALVQEFHYTEVNGDTKTVCRFGTEFNFFINENGVGAEYFMQAQYKKVGKAWKLSNIDDSGYMTAEKIKIRKLTKEKLFALFKTLEDGMNK